MDEVSRFVQVSTGPPTGTVRLGSGFLLSSDIVVTARHVLLPPTGSADASISVRGPQQDQWTPAELIWPASRAELDAAPDVALIQLRGVAAGEAVSSRPLGIGSDEDRDPTLRVHAVGYPGFKKPRDTHQIEAKLQLYGGIRYNAFELTDLDLNTGNPGARSDADDWGGFSGAPVFAGRRIIAVIAAVQDRGRYDFRATRLDQLLTDERFLALLPRATRQEHKPAPSEIPPLDNLVYLLDRDDQELEFHMAHGRCCPAAAEPKAAATKPLVCVLPSIEPRHAPYAFLSRLADKVLPELQWPTGAIDFKPLPWPKRADGVAAKAQALRGALWRHLCGAGPAPDAPEDFAELFHDPSRPRTFYSEIGEQPLGDATADVLAAWLDFLGGIAVRNPCPPTHLLFVKASYEDAARWLQRVGGQNRLRVELLTELGLCSTLERDEWAEKRLPQLHRPALQNIRTALWREFNQGFFAEDFQLRITDLLSARLHG